jgi:uncharacterized protein involved in exopolysaccharide biosynthesis
MALTASRWLVLVAAVVVVFGVTVAIALQLVPGPHSETDYLVIGSVATLLSLVVVFVVLMITSPKASELFFRRRPKG